MEEGWRSRTHRAAETQMEASCCLNGSFASEEPEVSAVSKILMKRCYILCHRTVRDERYMGRRRSPVEVLVFPTRLDQTLNPEQFKAFISSQVQSSSDGDAFSSRRCPQLHHFLLIIVCFQGNCWWQPYKEDQ